MAERFDRIWLNARLATVREDMPGLGVIEDGLIAARDGRIAFAGSRSDFPSGADAALTEGSLGAAVVRAKKLVSGIITCACTAAGRMAATASQKPSATPT